MTMRGSRFGSWRAKVWLLPKRRSRGASATGAAMTSVAARATAKARPAPLATDSSRAFSPGSPDMTPELTVKCRGPAGAVGSIQRERGMRRPGLECSVRAEPPRATSFLLAALAWSLGLFALLRSPWVEARLVLPLTRLQEQAADYYAGRPPVPIAVTPECSGTDVLALCLAAILACPVPWRARLAGATGGVALVLALNTLRIATLGRAAASPALFQTLHLQVWPAILVLATAGYVFAWMRGTLGATRTDGGG